MNIDNYINSYNKQNFLESVSVKNKDGGKNDYYLWESFTTWLDNSDSTADEYIFQDKQVLKTFNNQLINFVSQVIYLYRHVGYYQLDNSCGKTGILIGQDKVLGTLSSIKFSADIIDDYILKGNNHEAILFRKYCIKKFNETVDNIEVILSIQLKKSPLKNDIKNVSNVLDKSINLKELEYLREVKKSEIKESQQVHRSEEIYIPKPFFIASSIEDIITTLNSYFDVSQQNELKRIIETGSNTKEKLLFKDSGNRLTDYLKRLFEKDIITSCLKKDLINWIVENFKYTNRGIEKDFIYRTVEKTISGNGQPCKNQIT